MPIVSEVAALIVGDYESSHHKRDIIVETQDGCLQCIPTLSSANLPLQYRWFFPYCVPGWCENITYSDDSSGPTIKREYVTLHE